MPKSHIFLFLLYAGNVLSQVPTDSLRNNIWITGYHYSSEDTTQLMWLDFSEDSMVIHKRFAETPAIYYANGSICDQTGQLLFYTNGCQIVDSNYNDILNGLIMNDGPNYDRQCPGTDGSPITSGLIILPIDTNLFSILHLRYVLSAQYYPYVNQFLETRILKSENGLEVLYTDSLVYESNDPALFWGNIATVRHGNGKDWWVVLPEETSDNYHIFKVGKDSIFKSSTQAIGPPSMFLEGGSGEAAFSPDGRIYARYLPITDLRLFEFDRCEGVFFNPKLINIADAADSLISTGLSFSRSGRYLHLSSYDRIYQLDMEATNIAASQTTVAIYDGFLLPGNFSTRFGKMELGPDGKIYIACISGRTALHVIEFPDVPGINCTVNQHKYVFEDAAFSGGLPAYPNFKLGPTVNPCETTGSTELPVNNLPIDVFPNPSNGFFQLKKNEAFAQVQFQLTIFDALGSSILSRKFNFESEEVIDLYNAPNGLYWLELVSEDGSYHGNARLIKQ